MFEHIEERKEYRGRQDIVFMSSLVFKSKAKPLNGLKQMWNTIYILLIAVLLRYNPPTIKFFLLKWAVQWVLVYSLSCATKYTL